MAGTITAKFHGQHLATLVSADEIEFAPRPTSEQEHITVDSAGYVVDNIEHAVFPVHVYQRIK